MAYKTLGCAVRHEAHLIVLINELKDKELAMQEREIAYLKELNGLLKKESAQ